MGIVILGAGGHSGVVLDIINEIESVKKIYEDIVLLDDNIPVGTIIYGKAISGKIEDCLKYPKDMKFVIGIGNNKIRKKIAEKYMLNYITLVHPSTVIGRNVSMGKGTVVMPGAVINCASKIGEHCIINTGATIDHECKIGNFVHISPGVHLGGDVKIGDESWIGIGSCMKNGIEICNNVTIGAGAVAIHDFPAGCTAVGNPAKVIKKK